MCESLELRMSTLHPERPAYRYGVMLDEGTGKIAMI